MKIYKFYAEWCNPCKALTKAINNSDIKDMVISVNCSEDSEDLCTKYGIRGIPTLVFVDNKDNILEKITGNVSIEDIKKIIDKYKE